MGNHGIYHWQAVKWLLKYLNGSTKYGLKYSEHPQGVKLMSYVDFNYTVNRDNRKSTTSYVFTLCMHP